MFDSSILSPGRKGQGPLLLPSVHYVYYTFSAYTHLMFDNKIRPYLHWHVAACTLLQTYVEKNNISICLKENVRFVDIFARLKRAGSIVSNGLVSRLRSVVVIPSVHYVYYTFSAYTHPMFDVKIWAYMHCHVAALTLFQ